MTIKDKLLLYCYRKICKLENDKEDLNALIRQRSLDSLDHYEIMRSKIAIQTADEILREITDILLNCSEKR